MSIEKDTSYVYDNVFSKVRYDEETGSYIIKREDYEHLNLSNRQLSILRKMCKTNKVKLEKISLDLGSVEDVELFSLYNQLKSKIFLCTDSHEKALLEEKRRELRNRIVADNLGFVRKIIDLKFHGIDEMQNKDDIYQVGYEKLLFYVDRRDIIYPKIFTDFVSMHLVQDIQLKLVNEDKRIGRITDSYLSDVSKVKKDNHEMYLSAKELANKTGLCEKRVEGLLNLENLLEIASLDYEVQREAYLGEKSLLYNDSFEKELIRISLRELLIKLISTLPKQQSDLLMKMYGFRDGNCYSDADLAKLYNVSREAISLMRKEALFGLRLSIRSRFLLDYFEGDLSDKYMYESGLQNRRIGHFDEFLISSMPLCDIVVYVNHIPMVFKDYLKLYYGLDGGKRYSVEEISKIMKCSKTNSCNIKNKAHRFLKMKIMEINMFTEEEYYNYMFNKYVMYKDKRTRKR